MDLNTYLTDSTVTTDISNILTIKSRYHWYFQVTNNTFPPKMFTMSITGHAHVQMSMLKETFPPSVLNIFGRKPGPDQRLIKKFLQNRDLVSYVSSIHS